MPLPQNISSSIRLPIIVAPMFLVSSKELVIASCTNGAMAAYPFQNSRTIDALSTCLDDISTQLKSEKTNCPEKKIAPWVASLIVHKTYERFDEELELIKKYKPQIVITALGSPSRVMPTVKEYGGLVFADVSSLAFAQKAIQAGVDGLILLSAGAGGHTGHLNPFAFIHEVRKIFNGIIILSGGINTAREIKAAQLLGADLVYMGTHFIATTESAASTEYKALLVKSTIDDIVTTKAVTGVSANFIQHSLQQANIDPQVSIQPVMDFSERYGNTPKAWKDIWSAGHGVSDSVEIVSCLSKIDVLVKAYHTI